MLLQAFLKTSFISNPTSLGGCQLSFYVFFWYSSLHGEKKVGGYWERCAGTSWEQLGHGWRPFSLHAVHLRALNESVKQFLNTDILLPWHIEQGMKAKPPHVWHVWGCCTLCGTTHTHLRERQLWKWSTFMGELVQVFSVRAWVTVMQHMTHEWWMGVCVGWGACFYILVGTRWPHKDRHIWHFLTLWRHLACI